MTATDTDKLANVPGTITIGDRELTVASLSQRGERALWQELESVYSDAETVWQRSRAYLAEMKKDDPQAWQVTVMHLGELVARGARPDFAAVERARRTIPRVLARELYRRAKVFHPAIKLEELEVIVTTANVEDLYYQLIEAVGGDKDDPKATR